jgi:hypothetical protein
MFLSDVMKTIDLTPSWSALVPAMLAVLENPKAEKESKEFIRGEFRRMAEFCDQVNKESKGK